MPQHWMLLDTKDANNIDLTKSLSHLEPPKEWMETLMLLLLLLLSTVIAAINLTWMDGCGLLLLLFITDKSEESTAADIP